MRILNSAHNGLLAGAYIDLLSQIPQYRAEIDQKVRHYTLRRHTTLVVAAYMKYFQGKNQPTGVDVALFRCMLALHDIGKARAYKAMKWSEQGLFTVSIINSISGDLKLNSKEAMYICSICGQDSLGLFLQGKISLQTALTSVQKCSKALGLTMQESLHHMSVYYQCDICSYTEDDGGLPFLEHLFLYMTGEKVYLEDKNRLSFAPIYEEKFKTLETYMA